MADYEVSNKVPAAAAAASLPISKEEVSLSPLPATHDVVKKTKPPRPQLAATVLVDVKTPPPASPADDDDDDNTDDDKDTPPPVADRVLHTISLWAMVHALAFGVTMLVDDSAPCTPRTWLLPPCVVLTDAAYAEVTALLIGELCCFIAAVAAAVPLHKLLTGRTATIRRMRGLWWVAAAADALAWVALAATAGLDSIQVASDRIYLAADPGKKYFLVSAVLASGCLAVNVVLAGFLLCRRRFPRRLGLGEHQSDDDGEV